MVQKMLALAVCAVLLIQAPAVRANDDCIIRDIQINAPSDPQVVQVVIQLNNRVLIDRPGVETHEAHLVLFLKGCVCTSGSHEKAGDGRILNKIRWNYKKDKKSVWMVVEHSPGVTHDLKVFPGSINLTLSGRGASEKTGPARVPPTPEAKTELSGFVGRKSGIPKQLRHKMTDVSMHQGCPVGFDALNLVTVSYWDFDNRAQTGELVVHRDVADEVIGIFRDLFAARFPIERMRLIDEYGGSDDQSMADNNTSAFNCRLATGSKDKYSLHSYGRAIDINPLVNPYVKDDTVLPPAGHQYTDRQTKWMGMIVHGDRCHRAFTQRGWRWGGSFKSLKDYQHFDKAAGAR